MKHIKQVTRRGRIYLYLARPGKKLTRLPDLPENHPRFISAYAEAWDSGERKITQPTEGTVSALCASWRASHEFRHMAENTRNNKAGIMKRLEERVGHVKVAAIQTKHIAADMERQPPNAANNLLKVWRKLMKHAVKLGLREDNPARDVERVKPPKSRGYYTWKTDEIEVFKEHHPAGSMARLALYLLLFLGRRRSEVVSLGRQHLEDGGIWISQPKTDEEEDGRMWLPLHPDLAAEIAQTGGRMTFLESGHGKPFATGNSFGNWWKDRCREAGLAHWGTHGGRKAVATFLAEAGASAHQIKAITGHKTLAEVQRYTEAVQQRLMAESAMGRLNSRKPEAEVSNLAEKASEIKVDKR